MCHQESPRKQRGQGIEWHTSASHLCWWCYLLGENINVIKQNAEALLAASKTVSPEVNTEKTKHMFMSYHQISGHNDYSETLI